MPGNGVLGILRCALLIRDVFFNLQIQFGTQLDPASTTKIFRKWQTELELKYGNFSCKEYVIAHQISLLKLAGTRASRRMSEFYQKDPISTYLMKGIEECKSAGKLNLAAKYTATLRELPNIRESIKVTI